MTPKSDIQNRQDIVTFVNAFYDKINRNDLLGPIFNDIAHVDWEDHLPVMFDFWENIIFGRGKYQGNPMVPHILLNQQFPLMENHFKEWKRLFKETIDEFFEGEMAERTKSSAENIAGVMQFKMQKMREVNS